MGGRRPARPTGGERGRIAVGAFFAALVALAALELSGGASARAQGWVLPAEAAPAVAEALRLEDGLSGGSLTLDARIARDRVVVTARSEDDERLVVTLLHPSAGGDGAVGGAGVILERTPGPAPEALVAELIARLEASAVTVPWRQRGSAAARGDADGPAWAVRRALHAVRIGEPEDARRRLDALPDSLGLGVRLDAALVWRLLGDDARVAAAIGDLAALDGANLTLAKALLAPEARPMSAEDALADAPDEGACGLVRVAVAWIELGRLEAARALAGALRERAPGCEAAWEAEIRALLWLREPEAARAALAEARRAHPESPRIVGVEADVLRAAGELGAAVDALEALAKARPEEAGRLASLLATFLQLSAEEHATRIAALERRLAEDPDDHVARFLIGVGLHYDNAFERSSELLRPLEAEFGHEPRLHIYLAMNDFNVGRREEALARLDRAAELPAMDPDVYYCRGEVLRDTDRPRARAELARYMAASAPSWAANPAKQERIAALIAAVDRCLAEDVAVCEGPWEHPRAQYASRPAASGEGGAGEESSGEGPSVGVLVGGGVGLAFAALGLLAWWRARRRRATTRV